MNFLITIGITCFNAEKTIERAIKSALAQDYSDFEILIIDDCSTDKSPVIINRLASQNNRIRYYPNEKNLGCSLSRNKIVENALGKYVAFFDDDDVSEKNRLSNQLESIRLASSLLGSERILCYARSSKIYPNGYIKDGSGPRKGAVPGGQSIFDYVFAGEIQNLAWGDGVPTATLMCQVDHLKEIGSFDPQLKRVEDIDMALRAGQKDFYFLTTQEILVKRYHTEGADKVSYVNYASELFLIDKYKSQLSAKRMYLETFYWFRIRADYFNKNYVKLLMHACALSFIKPAYVARKIMTTVPRRIIHELKMKGDNNA